MFANAKNPSTRRSTTLRRALLARTSLLAAMSFLTIGLAVAEPVLAARPQSRQDHRSQAHSERRVGRTVIRTFSSPGAVTVNNATTASPYPSAIPVSRFRSGRVTDVNVVLQGLNHPWPDDIDVMLVAPDGRSTILLSDVGDFGNPGGANITLDDQALTILPDGGPLVGGVFRPANYELTDAFPSVSAPSTSARLSRFNGSAPNGDWKLYVVDDTDPDGGVFTGGWSLQLTVELDQNNRRRRDRR